jgi:hypothetical protein
MNPEITTNCRELAEIKKKLPLTYLLKFQTT